MGKYINYERIEEVVNKEQLIEVFKKIIENGQDIISYWERKMDTDRIHVVVVVGKPNEGKQVL